MMYRRVRGPAGFGGQPRLPSRFTIERDGAGIALGSTMNVELRTDDRLIIETVGAGGSGDPRAHDRGGAAGSRERFINDAEAHDVYGLETPSTARTIGERNDRSA